MSVEYNSLIECKLYISVQRDRVRMVPRCVRIPVRIGSEYCDHFLPTNGKNNGSEDITDKCTRARECRRIGSQD